MAVWHATKWTFKYIFVTPYATGKSKLLIELIEREPFHSRCFLSTTDLNLIKCHLANSVHLDCPFVKFSHKPYYTFFQHNLYAEKVLSVRKLECYTINLLVISFQNTATLWWVQTTQWWVHGGYRVPVVTDC